MSKKILACVGTRPNFIKVAKLRQAAHAAGFEYALLHTGQHFDVNMSQVFFEQLQLGEPDHYLDISARSHHQSVGRIMESAGEVMEMIRPDVVLVPGDVNSTFACAFAAHALDIPVAHIESGLRSFDMSMPEERNRILTDALSRFLFVTEPIGVQQLRKEGKSEASIQLVGNTIIDALMLVKPLMNRQAVQSRLGLRDKAYAVATFHRPVNVDEPSRLSELFAALGKVSERLPIVLPLHPRTRNRLETQGLLEGLDDGRLVLMPPLGYVDFLALVDGARMVLSDSGGIQTETSFLGVPCLTVRDTTESVFTLEQGTNRLVAFGEQTILEAAEDVLHEDAPEPVGHELWDGNATERIIEHLKTHL